MLNVMEGSEIIASTISGAVMMICGISVGLVVSG